MTIYKNFSELCAVLLESSTINAVLKNSPGSQQVVQTMHSKFNLGHDAGWQPENLKFGDIKEIAGKTKHVYFLLIGETGSAGIIYINRALERQPSSYAVIASDGAEPKELKTAGSRNILAFIKPIIGKVQESYVSYQHVRQAPATVLKKEREANKTQPLGYLNTQLSLEANARTLLYKFKPLWKKAINSAIADIKGAIMTMVKNDAWNSIDKKINRVRRLEKYLYMLEYEQDIDELNGSMGRYLTYALYMTASYYYPELTGNISGNPYSGYGSGTNVQSTEGAKKIIADIAAGDNSKLSALLTFFKQGLIA